MGIGRDQFIVALSNIKAGTGNRTQLRRQVARLHDASNEWLSRFDAQENAAPAAFAQSRQAQFNTFTAALPDITVDAADPDDQLP